MEKFNDRKRVKIETVKHGRRQQRRQQRIKRQAEQQQDFCARSVFIIFHINALRLPLWCEHRQAFTRQSTPQAQKSSRQTRK
ncbi:hypothetical protein SM39_2212 [Serratia marcescens SM39]|uniref:Uncharacterized protein n=1 Tax=Serratia marcescens SM39 TaxID=1334564 RepID=A0AAT9DUT7_SERMA|nr:hypothetical protein SM39_2212 [Serratia marcescens SM39]